MKNNPYVGPRPYQRRHSRNFYGRNREARDLLSLLLAERVVLFYAPSGAGKTSLLNAKVLPALEEDGFQVLPPVRVGSAIPPTVSADTIPNVYIFSVLLGLAGDKLSPEQLPPYTLSQFLQEFYPAQEDEATMSIRPQLLICDQFEELFTAHPEYWEQVPDFFRQIRAALQKHRNLGVLFSMREDYVAEVEPYAPLLPTRMKARYRIEPLKVQGALEAVRKPALNAGCPFAPGVAEQLVDDLRRIKVQRHGKEVIALGPYVEPVQLQVVCNLLWDRLPEQADNSIDAEDVAAMGNVSDALLYFYEDVLRQTVAATGVSERQLRRWFGEQLITPMQTRGLALRGMETTAGLPNKAVDFLHDRHLIRSDTRAGARWYELAHDSLITPVLRSNQAWEQAHDTPLRKTAREWATSKDPALLYRGTLLETAQQWAATHPDEVEDYELQFIEASIAQARQEARRRRLQLLGVAIGTTVLLIVTMLAWMAIRSSLTAYSRQLAAESREWRERDQVGSIRAAWHGTRATGLGEAMRILYGQPLLGRVDTTDAQIALRQSLLDVYPAIVHPEQPDQVQALIYSPDGKTLYSDYASLGVGIWSMETQTRTMLHWPFPGGAIWDLEVSSDGQMLFVAGDNGREANTGDDEPMVAQGLSHITSQGGVIGVWNVQAHTWQQWLQVTTPITTYDEVYSLALCPGGTYLAAGGDYDAKYHDRYGDRSGLIRLWKRNADSSFNTHPTLNLGPFPERIIDLSCTRAMSGVTYLAAASHDGNVRVWQLHTIPGGITATQALTLSGHSDAVNAVAFSPTEPLLASASADRTIRLWDLRTGAEVLTLVGHSAQVTRLAFSPDGAWLFSGSRDSSVRVWDINARNSRSIHMLTGPRSLVMSLAVSPNGKYVAAGAGDNSLRIWDLDFPARHQISTLTGGKDIMRGVAYSPDGSKLVANDNQGMLRVWDAQQGHVIRILSSPVDGASWNLSYSHDGRYLVTGYAGGDIIVRDGTTYEVLADLQEHQGGINSAVFSPDDRYLLSASDDQQVFVWDVATWQVIAKLHVPDISRPGEAWTADYSPDGRWIAAGYASYRGHPVGRIQVWRVTSAAGQPFSAEPVFSDDHTHSGYLLTTAFSPDGRYLVTGGFDNLAVIWDTRTFTTVARLEHPGYVYKALFSPDGRYLATGARDGHVRLWDLSHFPAHSPQLIADNDAHTDVVWSLAFSPDGKFLASSSWDRTVRRYLVPPDEVEKLAEVYLRETR